jgi:hypothetical protein
LTGKDRIIQELLSEIRDLREKLAMVENRLTVVEAENREDNRGIRDILYNKWNIRIK